MTRSKHVMGNWKMNGSLASITALIHHMQAQLTQLISVQCTVFPPTVYLPHVANLVRDTVITYGAQNIYPKDSGAYTGEVSAPMVKEFGCQYVLVGHSERRILFKENEKFVAEKFHQVKEHGMIPVLCVGETQDERQCGKAEQILSNQLQAIRDISTNDDPFGHCVIAYEPVWAIGTGVTPSPLEVQAMHEFIRRWVGCVNSEVAQSLTILYGGSVNSSNARQLFAMPDVDGGLVGGAALNAEQFVEIVKCIN